VGCYAGTQIANDLLGAREGTEPPSSLRVIGGFFVLYNRDTQITAHARTRCFGFQTRLELITLGRVLN